MIGSSRASRVALVVAALALLAGTPAVLVAAHVRNPWALAGATALAAVVVAFGAVWQQRYTGLLQHRDLQAFKTEDGCLVRADGRLPRVGDITDSVLLGVHKAAPAAIPAGRVSGLSAGEHVPAYVPRDTDDGLRELLAAGGFVLLVGDSTAGKTRTAFEAMTATLTDHLLICPAGREAVAVASAAQARRCVLWLDDLEGYLGTGGLTAARLARLLAVMTVTGSLSRPSEPRSRHGSPPMIPSLADAEHRAGQGVGVAKAGVAGRRTPRHADQPE